jgi:hypothetical protein
MEKPKDATEKGPIYGVELIDTLPLGTGPMLQQMPCRDDLERVAERSQRTVAGYEVLLAHYRELLSLARGYEEWEGDLILNGDWSGSYVRMTQAQHDRMLELQAQRNAAIRKVDAI